MAAGKLRGGADIDQLRPHAGAFAIQFVRGNDCASFNGCFHDSPPVRQLPKKEEREVQEKDSRSRDFFLELAANSYWESRKSRLAASAALQLRRLRSGD
jgi:hypothetical protein